MATTSTKPIAASTTIASPVEVLRSVTDTDVTVTTHEGQVTGSVLSCTRLSVWIISDDEDVVVAVDDIVDVFVHG